jgi:iron complex transport system ATP-binding protein
MNIDLDKIDFSYPGRQILNEIIMHAASGQFTGIIGPNGSGKSTLLKCIYRVLSPKNGTIYLNGKSLSDMTIKESARHVAVMAQQNYYQFEFTVEDIVLMGRAPHKRLLETDTNADMKMVQSALQTVDMGNFSHRMFSSLSGGEQQRVILARALVQDTECMILDEPTNHLDITHQIQMMKMVKNMHHTVLAAMHDLNIAVEFCDYIYVMSSGKIFAQGTPSEVFTPNIISAVYDVPIETVYDSIGHMHILFLNSI